MLGISDHGFTTKIKSIGEDKLESYISDLKNLRENEDRLELKIGLEIDTSIRGIDPRKIPLELINQPDYVLFEYLREGKNIPRIYRNIDCLLEIRDKLKIPVGLAHPEMKTEFSSIDAFSKILGENDIFFDMPLNVNCNDVRYKYSKEELNVILQYNVKFAIGTDVHTKSDNPGNINAGIKYLKHNNLQVIDMVK